MKSSSLPAAIILLFTQGSSSLSYSNAVPLLVTTVGFCSNDSLCQQYMSRRRRFPPSALSKLQQHQHQCHHQDRHIDVIGSSRDHAPTDSENVTLHDSSTSRGPLDRRSLLSHVASMLTILTTIPFTDVTNSYASYEAVSSQSPSMDTTKTIGTESSTRFESQPILTTVKDPNTYEAIVYSPPRKVLPAQQQQAASSSSTTSLSSVPAHPPLIVVLHGAGKNNLPIMDDLGNPNGEHAGLIPSLIVSSFGTTATSTTTGVGGRDVRTIKELTAPPPPELVENFAVIAPYSFGKQSFYEEPRKKLLDFIDWAIENRNTEALPIQFDPQNIILFGFSDGSTVAVELLTTRRFVAGVICSYGFGGKQLPPRALEKLANIPMWVFHSRDDVIFDVSNSDRLVAQLNDTNHRDRSRSSTAAAHDRGSSDQVNDIIHYSRFESDPENLPKRIRGHSMGITASKSPELYHWLLDITMMNRRRS